MDTAVPFLTGKGLTGVAVEEHHGQTADRLPCAVSRAQLTCHEGALKCA